MMIIIALLFVILGIIVKNGKNYHLIAGYNSLPEEEKSKYNIEVMATIFRNTMFGMALFIMAGILFSDWLDEPKIEWYALFLAIVIGVPYLLVKINSDKIKTKNK